MSNTLRRLAVSLSVVALSFGASACGSDEPGTPVPTTSASAPATDAPATEAPATEEPATGVPASGDRAANEALVTGWVSTQLSTAGMENVDSTCVAAVVAQLSEEDMVLMAEAAANNEPSVPTLSAEGDALGSQVGACGTIPTAMMSAEAVPTS